MTTPSSLHTFKLSNLSALKAACSTCSLREICLPLGLSLDEIDKLDHIVQKRVKVPRGKSLYQAGDKLSSLYAVKLGVFKLLVLSPDGREQITGFYMAGDLLGLDAIGTDSHHCTAVALEDSEVCAIPFDALEDLSHQIPSLQQNFYKIMSREIVRDQKVMLLLGNLRADERLAAFLVNLSQRLAARGYSPLSFVLRMTREEIGSYLGLKLETVSRGLSQFQNEGLIEVNNKSINIINLSALEHLVSGCAHVQKAAS